MGKGVHAHAREQRWEVGDTVQGVPDRLSDHIRCGKCEGAHAQRMTDSAKTQYIACNFIRNPQQLLQFDS